MNDLERKKEALQRELARRQAPKSTSGRQAQYLAARAGDVIDDHEDRDERDERETEPARRRKGPPLTTSQIQAAYVLRANRYLQAALDEADADEGDDTPERPRAWGDHLIERPELEGDVASRRQAAYVTRGASRRGDS